MNSKKIFYGDDFRMKYRIKFEFSMEVMKILK